MALSAALFNRLALLKTGSIKTPRRITSLFFAKFFFLIQHYGCQVPMKRKTLFHTLLLFARLTFCLYYTKYHWRRVTESLADM